MLDFFYWLSGIVINFLTGKKKAQEIKNVKVHQTAESMSSVRGIEMKLTEGEDVHVKNMEIVQDAQHMQGVKGLSIKASGKQSARLQGVHIKQPHGEVIISDDPNVKVEINKLSSEY